MRRNRNVFGYKLKSRWGRTTYIGITNNPRRRAAQHRRSGKQGRLTVSTRKMTRSQARRWEAAALSNHRRSNRGRNPRYNKTRTGGRRY